MSVTRLFDGWEETMIWSCLQGYMGTLTAAGPDSARITVGDFCFFAGRPDQELIQTAAAPILVPRDEQWQRMIKNVRGDHVFLAYRYATCKEADVFDREHLQSLVRSLPTEYELRPIDEGLYTGLVRQEWSRDLCSQFNGCEDYLARGIGVAAICRGIPAAGASSYTVYSGGIEIEIDTAPGHRRRGLAAACGAQLILECLDRGLYPSWDAHDLRSASLAQKLGYRLDRPYPVFISKDFSPVPFAAKG